MFLWLCAFSACCRDYNNFEPLRNTKENIHIVKLEEVEKIGSYSLPTLYLDHYDTSLTNKYLDSININFIIDQLSLEKVLRISDSFGAFPQFNFNQFILAPVRYHKPYGWYGDMEFQPMLKINHEARQYILIINTKFTCSGRYSDNEYQYMTWIKMPKPPAEFSLRYIHN